MIRVAVLACIGALAVATAAGAAATPRLILRSGTPVQLRGVGFAADERVTLLANGKKVWRHVVVANASGVFAVQLPLVFRLTKCEAFLISATGGRGDHAFAGMAGAGCEPAPGIINPSR